jgi:hypothetical protein
MINNLLPAFKQIQEMFGSMVDNLTLEIELIHGIYIATVGCRFMDGVIRITGEIESDDDLYHICCVFLEEINSGLKSSNQEVQKTLKKIMEDSYE